jgi:hypothetical protein
MSNKVLGILGGKVGLRNLGNTCYLNSLMQVFLHVPVIRNYYSNEMTGILQGYNNSNTHSISSGSSSSSSRNSTGKSSKNSRSSRRSSMESLLPNETPEITADPDDPALLSRQLVVLSRLIWGKMMFIMFKMKYFLLFN